MTEINRSLPVWRSMLFVPVTVDKFVDSAHRRGADAIILDLEDSILPKEKARARTLVEAAATKVSRGGADVVVRVNRPWRLCVRDLEAVVCTGVNALMLAKTEGADHVNFIAEILDELEAERGLPRGHTQLIAVIESAQAFLRSREIAAAHSRIVALTLGSEDFSLSMGMEPEAEGLLYPKQHMAIAARAAGVLPLGFVGSVANYSDLEGFRVMVRRARRLGFTGATVIHPMQIDVLNEEFRPSTEELAKARRIVAAFTQAALGRDGAIELDGKMVDIPIVERARRALERHEAIERRAGSKG
jgi:citrate lyase subunit beta / citryl-CoA lyase